MEHEFVPDLAVGQTAEPAADPALGSIIDPPAGGVEAPAQPVATASPVDEVVSRWSGVWATVSIAATFVTVYAVLFYFYRPNLLFSLTTTSGGDTGAHHYPAQYMIQELLPNLRLTGWAPGWYAGMPMLTFYFPLPFLLIAFLNVILPYQLAFKLVTALGVFLLPVTLYAYGRLMRIRQPFPQLAAAAGLGFLLMESYSIYGANILSTLAGEFGYSLSFALVFLFLGTLHRGMERGRFDWLFVVNVAILTALVLSHIVTTIVLCVIAPGLLLIHRRRWALLYMVVVFGFGFCLTAFWGLPFLDKLEWTAHMAWNQLDQLKDLLPIDLRPAAALGVLGLAYALARKDSRVLPLLWISVTMVVAFYLLPDGRLWNARLLPFLYVSVFLWAAYGLTWLLRPFVVMTEDLLALPSRVGRWLYGPVVAIIVGVIVITASTTASGWIRWNYSGYEGKEAWPTYDSINDFLAELNPPGRVMVEHSDKIDKFGTPRAFEIIPYWTPQDTMEGTLMEASFTAPFHFINQAELSVQPSNAIVGVEYPGRDTQRGLTHLQMMNIPYLLTVSPEVTAEVDADQRTDKLATFDEMSVFRVSGTSGYVEVAKNQPLRMAADDWRTPIVDWYKQEAALDVPIVWDRGEPELQQFDSIDPSEVTNPPKEPIAAEGQVIGEQLENERLTFETSAIGVPHLIKVSYFPNWKVQGADGPFVVSPSFMMVIPRQREVTLTYGRTASNTVGQLLGLFGVAGIAALVVVDRRRGRGQERPSAEAARVDPAVVADVTPAPAGPPAVAAGDPAVVTPPAVPPVEAGASESDTEA